MQKEIKQTWFFNQDAQEVWQYLTTPELMEQWLMKSDFQPVVGHKFSFMHKPKTADVYEPIVAAEVLEVSPVTRLSYSWETKTKDGSKTFNSTVLWTLTPKGNGTELVLLHDGFIMAEDAEMHNTGWAGCMKKLDKLINSVENGGVKA